MTALGRAHGAVQDALAVLPGGVRYLLGRLLVAVLVLFVVLSVMFAAIAVTPDPPKTVQEALAGAESPPGSPRDADTPLVERYVGFVTGYATLDWGTNSIGEPYTQVVWQRLAVSTVVLAPALVATSIVGVLFGLYSAFNPESVADRTIRTVAYVGFAVPSFFLAQLTIFYGIELFHWRGLFYDEDVSLWTVQNVRQLAIPSVVLAVGILGIQLRQIRNQTLHYSTSEFVKLARAKGGGFRTVGRHILRVAALPILSLFLSELLGILLLVLVAIEYLFVVPGIGAFLLEAAQANEAQPVMAATVVTVIVSIGGRFVEDVAALVLEPRTD